MTSKGGVSFRGVYVRGKINRVVKVGYVGAVRTLFGDINTRTQRHTFSRPNGLWLAAQFAQISLVVTEKAAFEDTQSASL